MKKTLVQIMKHTEKIGSGNIIGSEVYEDGKECYIVLYKDKHTLFYKEPDSDTNKNYKVGNPAFWIKFI